MSVRSIAEKGIYPAVDPLDSTSRMLDPQVIGEEHYAVARQVQEVLQRYKALQDIIAILGMDELSKKTRVPWRAPARSNASCRSPSLLLKSSPVRRASWLSLEDTIKGFKGLLPVSMTIFQKLPSTWSATWMKPFEKAQKWLRKPPDPEPIIPGSARRCCL